LYILIVNHLAVLLFIAPCFFYCLLLVIAGCVVFCSFCMQNHQFTSQKREKREKNKKIQFYYISDEIFDTNQRFNNIEYYNNVILVENEVYQSCS